MALVVVIAVVVAAETVVAVAAAAKTVVAEAEKGVDHHLALAF